MKGGYWNGDRCEAYLSISFKLTPLKDTGLSYHTKKVALRDEKLIDPVSIHSSNSHPRKKP